jgi:hypothetical protein
MTSNRVLRGALVASFLGGCAGPISYRQPAAEPDRLAGIWEICLKRHEATGNPQNPPATAGYIALTRMEQFTRPWMYLGEPTHYGVYTADLAQLDIARDPRIPLPLVGARVTLDSIYLVLDPFGSHGPVVVRGRIERDTASGGWFHQAYAFGAEGSFSMRHVGAHSLPVPYPIGVLPTPPALAGCIPSVDRG